MPFEISDGRRASLRAPTPPRATLRQPQPPAAHLVPVPGPPGPAGDLATLSDLDDVDVAGAQTGQPLVRGADGVWRPGQFPENQRGSVISLAETAPTALTTAHRVGDYIIAFGEPDAPIYQVEDT